MATPTLKLFQKQYANINSVDYYYNQLSTNFIKNFLRQHDRHCKQQYELFKRFLPFDYPEAMALAKHHLIPSRLLDWTTDPLIAAYFSAINDKNNNICVWALNKKYLNENPKQGQILFYEQLSRTGLEYLHIQKGLFTDMIGVEEYFYKYGTWPTLDQYLEKTCTEDDYFLNQENYIMKIELVSSEATKLLVRLDRMGINKYSLMPTYDNVGESVRIF